VGFALAIAIAGLAAQGGDNSPQRLEALRTNAIVRLIGLFGTTFFTGIGGYVAAKMSHPNGFSNSLVVGLVSVLLAVLLATAAPGMTPLWKLLIGLLATVPAALAGGYVAQRFGV